MPAFKGECNICLSKEDVMEALGAWLNRHTLGVSFELRDITLRRESDTPFPVIMHIGPVTNPPSPKAKP